MNPLLKSDGTTRICTRCRSGAPAVMRVKHEYICETCLQRRRERQANTAAAPKCSKCGGLEYKGTGLCANHQPRMSVEGELELLRARVTELELQVLTLLLDGEDG